MNVLFLSPQFPPQYVHFCRALRECGARVLGMGDAPWEALPPGLRAQLDDWAFVPRMARVDDAVEAARRLVAQHGPVRRIDGLNEHWMPLEAVLREALDVEGPRPAEVARWRSKGAVREVLRGAGVACTVGEPVRSAKQVRAFVRTHGLPVVLKPDTGVGAARTRRVSTRRELDEALSGPLEGLVVERFEPGRLVSWDGLVDAAGEVVFHLGHAYGSGVMEMVNDGRPPWYRTRREVPRGLEEMGRDALRAFGLRERFFHVEAFEHEGAHRLLEVNFRPPGGFTTDLMNWACDVDVYRLWARVVTGQDVAGFAYERRYSAAHLGRRRGVAYRLPDEVLRAEFGACLLDHRRLPPAVSAAMGDEAYLVRDADEGRVERMAELASAT